MMIELNAGRSAARRQEKPNVLVVDDCADMRHLISLALRRQFAVYEAADGREALQILQQPAAAGAQEERINLVLLDVMLPDGDGISLCGRIKSQYRVPVIMCSACSDRQNMQAAQANGADDYVVKPFHLPTLVQKVTQYACG